MTALSLSEGIGHTTAEDEVVHLVHEVFDDTDFGRNLRTTHDGSEGALDVVQYVVNSQHFLFHQVAKHLVVSVEAVSDNSGRSVLAVSRTKGIVNVDVSV